MTITNKLGLPDVLVQAVSNREPSDAYSASQLMKSPRQLWLGRKHHVEIVEDVSDRIWALFGTALHAIIEQANPENALTEERLSHEFPGLGKITGIPDLFQDGIISDWKTVSVWSYIYFDDDKRAEYASQLNTYAFLYRALGFEVKGLEIVMLMRDWQASKAKFDPDYPQSQVAKIKIPLWSQEKAETYIKAKLDYFETFRDTADDQLPECTEKERWAKPGKWALMKKGRKSAVKLYDVQPDIELEPGHYWEHRPGEQWKRCEYCNVSPFCNQYQKAHKEEINE
jgi:hypothetical protein